MGPSDAQLNTYSKYIPYRYLCWVSHNIVFVSHTTDTDLRIVMLQRASCHIKRLHKRMEMSLKGSIELCLFDSFRLGSVLGLFT